MEAQMLTGCCSIGIVEGFGVYPLPGESTQACKSRMLREAETSALVSQYSAVMGTVSTNQENNYKWAATMKKHGWKLVNTSVSKPYGGGEVYMYVKNLK